MSKSELCIAINFNHDQKKVTRIDFKWGDKNFLLAWKQDIQPLEFADTLQWLAMDIKRYAMAGGDMADE